MRRVHWRKSGHMDQARLELARVKSRVGIMAGEEQRQREAQAIGVWFA